MEKEGQQHVRDYTDSDSDEDFMDVYSPEPSAASKRLKRHTVAQIQALKKLYDECDHPDETARRLLSAKIGLEPRQVKYWFQNQCSQMQTKAMVQDNKKVQAENAALKTENVALHQAILKKSCVACGAVTVPSELSPERQRLLMENAQLKDEYMRATAVLTKKLRSASSSQRPGCSSTPHPVPPAAGEGRAVHVARLKQIGDGAMKQFMELATKGKPLWLPSPDGEVLISSKTTVPVHQVTCPGKKFTMEASRATGVVQDTARDLVAILTDPKRWCKMFPGVVANMTAGDAFISDGGVYTLMNAELWVQSPRLHNNRRLNFLRYTRKVADAVWAVMDVSVDGGIFGPLGSRTAAADPIANTTACRLLPSGYIIQDMGNGESKVTCVVHAEYDEATVPILFRPLFLSGKALGASRWLACLQRQCHYHDVLRLNNRVQIGDNTAKDISSMGRRGILELAQRLMASFYSVFSGPVTQASSTISQWCGGTGTGSERIGIAVRMVSWDKPGSTDGERVLSGSTTVWLPNTPPQLVFDYLCDKERRGEWDDLAQGAPVREVFSLDTGHLDGNAVSVLYSNHSDELLILQAACTDASSSMVVYTPVGEGAMRAAMRGGDHASIFLLPSGFAILPDGHGRDRHAPSSSSSARARFRDTSGSLLTVACQQGLMLRGSDHDAARTTDYLGNLLYRAIDKIQAAVKAKNVIQA